MQPGPARAERGQQGGHGGASHGQGAPDNRFDVDHLTSGDIFLHQRHVPGGHRKWTQEVYHRPVGGVWTGPPVPSLVRAVRL